MTSRFNLYLDRFENGQAVLLVNNVQINFPRELLPNGAASGDTLIFSIGIDLESSAKTGSEIDELRRRLVSGGEDPE